MKHSKRSRVQAGGFFKMFTTPKTKPEKEIYYEDIYGSPNEDEELDRFPDACESDPDSEDEKGKGFSSSADYKRFFSGSYAGDNARRMKSSQPASPTIEQNIPASEKRYKIAPNKNSSRSVELPSVRMQSVFVEADAEDEKYINDSPPALPQDWRRGLSKRAKRPLTRLLFKQELAEQDKEKKKKKTKNKQVAALCKEVLQEKGAARRKRKIAARRTDLPKEPPAKSNAISDKKAKLTEDLGTDEAEPEIGKAYVLVDLTGVDVNDFEVFRD